jgi:hypothetical protein
VPSFANDSEERNQLDFQLLRDGVVTLYRRAEHLAADRDALCVLGYKSFDFDARHFDGTEDLVRAMESSMLGSVCCKSIDGLDDHLWDFAYFDEGLADPAATGTLITFRHFDAFAHREPAVAEAVLNILTVASRVGLLIGHRILVLVQSDTSLAVGPLGGQPIARKRDVAIGVGGARPGE